MGSGGDKGRFKHQIRVSLGRACFVGFLQPERTDSRQFRDNPYDAVLTKRPQKTYHKDRYAWRGILLGAALSVACSASLVISRLSHIGALCVAV